MTNQNCNDFQKLQNQTFFLLHIAQKNYIKFFSDELEKIDLNFIEYFILLAMREHEALTITSLCSEIHIEPGSISPYIKGLSAKKLIFKRHNKRDRRSFVVKLSDAGKEKFNEIETSINKVNAKIGMTEDECKDYNEKLLTLIDKIDAATKLS